MIDLHNIGHREARFLKQAYLKKQLAQSYLFIDPDQQRALNTAYWLACLFNCTGNNPPDGTCINCRQILSGNHPDVLLVQSGDKQSLGIDQVRPLKEELAKSPVESKRRFFFINQAQKLTLPAANALLNLLEEPVAPVVTILIADNAGQILPTIRSRTQMITFTEAVGDDQNSLLLTNGFTQAEIKELGEHQNLRQKTKYFYQELKEKNDLALVSAHQLADLAKLNSQQKYVFFLLKQWAQADLLSAQQRRSGAALLKKLMTLDKMRYSHVAFRNLLDYLALS